MLNPKFEAILNRMRQVHDKKSQDYASTENRYSNFEFAAKCSALFADPLDQVFATLIGVKIARLGELRGKGKTPNNESVADSLLDLANYSALWASYYEPALPVPADYSLAKMRSTIAQEYQKMPTIPAPTPFYPAPGNGLYPSAGPYTSGYITTIAPGTGG